MSDPARRLADAERDAKAARERLAMTVTTLQARLDPRTLARATAADIADRTRAGVDRARRSPAMIAGSVLLAGLFLVRRPLANAVRRTAKIRPGKRPGRKKESV